MLQLSQDFFLPILYTSVFILVNYFFRLNLGPSLTLDCFSWLNGVPWPPSSYTGLRMRQLLPAGVAGPSDSYSAPLSTNRDARTYTGVATRRIGTVSSWARTRRAFT